MNSYIPSTTISLILLTVCVFCMISAPSQTFARTSKPTCALTVRTSIGTTTIQGVGEVLLQKGSTLRIMHESTGATKVIDGNGNTLSANGSRTKSPKKNTTYTYIFSNGSAKTVCSARVTIVSGEFATSTLRTNSSKPTIAGMVTGIEKIKIQIFKEGSTTPLYTSKTIKVRRGMWEAKISRKLPDGRYTVTVLGVKNRALNTFVSDTLRVGKDAPVRDASQGTLVVELVPLLLGGIARAGVPVAVSYLQVINIGRNPASIHGFTVVQLGNAPTKAIMGLTVVDDSGSLGGTVGGVSGETPFKDNRAFIPLDAEFSSGQMRLFTIKAVLADSVQPYVGSRLTIAVSGVDTSAVLRSSFPIRGTTWTIGL